MISVRLAGFALIGFCGLAGAQTKPAPVKMESPVQDKNFYLLSMLERTPAMRDAAKKDGSLARIAASRLAAFDSAAKTCNVDLACYAAAFEWTDSQSQEAARALGDLYRSSPSVRSFTDGPLKESGMYVRYNNLAGGEFLARAWGDCAKGMNHAIDTYGLGKAPRYPAIDSMTYDSQSDGWHQDVQHLVTVLENERAGLDLFFSPSLRFATELLWLNHRDEAGRFEPMETGENAAAFQRVKSVDWRKYPYSAIVVPGQGNDKAGIRLSAGGKLRDEVAASRFKAGKAPFVLVSGGFVHPDRTEFSEAVEMKHDLMTRFGIPANAIVIDPHARHTTTNMRNAARLMYRYGMPFDKKALVTSDPGQSQYIETPAFAKRCTDELGYVPYQILGRTSPFDLEFLPKIDSLQSDPQDPLDP